MHEQQHCNVAPASAPYLSQPGPTVSSREVDIA